MEKRNKRNVSNERICVEKSQPEEFFGECSYNMNFQKQPSRGVFKV